MTDRFETLIDTLDRRSESVLNQLKQATQHIKRLEDENAELRQQLEQASSKRDAVSEAEHVASVSHAGDQQSSHSFSQSSSFATEDGAPSTKAQDEPGMVEQSDMSLAKAGVPEELESIANVDESGEHDIVEEHSNAHPSTPPAATDSTDAVDSQIGKKAEESIQHDSALPSPQALLKQWYERYPDAFFKAHTHPLKVGIHKDLIAREPWPSKLIRRALANYVNLPRYLKSVRVGATRVDLDGQPAGDIGEEDVQHARDQLELLQKRRREREERQAAERMSRKIAQLNERLGH